MPDLIPFDLGARKVPELTFREALRMGHNYRINRPYLLGIYTVSIQAAVSTSIRARALLNQSKRAPCASHWRNSDPTSA